MEELNNFIGDSPDVTAFIKDGTCFVCGQPYNKSPQFEELKKLLAEKISQAYQAGQDDLKKKFKDKLFTGFKAPKGNEQFNNGWKQCRYQVLEIIKLMEKL